MIRRVLTAAILVAGLSCTCPADTIRNFNIGNWYAGVYSNDQTKAFTHCAASVRYKSGIYVVFSIDRSFNWKLALANPAWRLDTCQSDQRRRGCGKLG